MRLKVFKLLKFLGVLMCIISVLMIYYMAWCIDLKDILRWIITFGTTLVSGIIVMGVSDFVIMEEEIKRK